MVTLRLTTTAAEAVPLLMGLTVTVAATAVAVTVVGGLEEEEEAAEAVLPTDLPTWLTYRSRKELASMKGSSTPTCRPGTATRAPT